MFSGKQIPISAALSKNALGIQNLPRQPEKFPFIAKKQKCGTDFISLNFTGENSFLLHCSLPFTYLLDEERFTLTPVRVLV